MNKKELLEELKIKTHDANLPLKDTATNIVFGKGCENAPILFIGEAPGANEDLQGIPFVGKAGKKLDQLIESIGLDKNNYYVANILKYRPPNNRNPNMDEIKSHTPFLVDQINIIQPKVIVTLGNFSTKFVLADFNPDNMDTINGITKIHGQIFDKTINNISFKVMPLYHPAATIYNRELEKDLDSDFLKIKELLYN
jgi:DNA polymerase